MCPQAYVWETVTKQMKVQIDTSDLSEKLIQAIWAIWAKNLKKTIMKTSLSWTRIHTGKYGQQFDLWP